MSSVKFILNHVISPMFLGSMSVKSPICHLHAVRWISAPVSIESASGRSISVVSVSWVWYNRVCIVCIVEWFQNESQFKCQTAYQCTRSLAPWWPLQYAWVLKTDSWRVLYCTGFLWLKKWNPPRQTEQPFRVLALPLPLANTCEDVGTPPTYGRSTLCQPIFTCTFKGETSAKQLKTWSIRRNGNLLGSWGHQLLW